MLNQTLTLHSFSPSPSFLFIQIPASSEKYRLWYFLTKQRKTTFCVEDIDLSCLMVDFIIILIDYQFQQLTIESKTSPESNGLGSFMNILASGVLFVGQPWLVIEDIITVQVRQLVNWNMFIVTQGGRLPEFKLIGEAHCQTAAKPVKPYPAKTTDLVDFPIIYRLIKATEVHSDKNQSTLVGRQ